MIWSMQQQRPNSRSKAFKATFAPDNSISITLTEKHIANKFMNNSGRNTIYFDLDSTALNDDDEQFFPSQKSIMFNLPEALPPAPQKINEVNKVTQATLLTNENCHHHSHVVHDCKVHISIFSEEHSVPMGDCIIGNDALRTASSNVDPEQQCKKDCSFNKHVAKDNENTSVARRNVEMEISCISQRRESVVAIESFKFDYNFDRSPATMTTSTTHMCRHDAQDVQLHDHLSLGSVGKTTTVEFNSEGKNSSRFSSE